MARCVTSKATPLAIRLQLPGSLTGSLANAARGVHPLDGLVEHHLDGCMVQLQGCTLWTLIECCTLAHLSSCDYFTTCNAHGLSPTKAGAACHSAVTCELHDASSAFRDELVLDRARQHRRSGMQESGVELSVTDVSVNRRLSFLDYMAGGCEIQCMLAVDFSSNNAPIDNPASFHYAGEQPLSKRKARHGTDWTHSSSRCGTHSRRCTWHTRTLCTA